jgi:hypothetical protein
MLDEREKEIRDRVVDGMFYILNLTDETSDASIITMYKETRQSIREWITALNTL